MHTPSDLKKIKQTLEEQRENLLAFVDKKQSSINGDDLSNPDNADRAMTSRDHNREMLIMGHIKGQLDDIGQALKRLEIGTYGVCAACGENIQPARLEIIPTASLCVECQRIQDAK